MIALHNPMLLFLRKIIPLPKHVINKISPSTFLLQHLTKYVTFETPQKPDLVITFLKNHGFSKPQILLFTKHDPRLLVANPHKSFLPKIEFFKSRGLSSSDITRLLCRYPDIMKRSLHKQLIPNMKLLREVGVPESAVMKLLQWYPRTFFPKTGKFNMIVKKIKEMGFDPLKHHFIMGVYALASISTCTWSRKANLYKKWGWSDEDVVDAFRCSPSCMKISEDKIEAIMEILVNELDCPPSTITSYAVVFSYSLHKRIVPRASVFQVLLSKGLVKKERLLGIFVLVEKEFLRKFVYCHELEANELLELYHSKLDLARKLKTW